MRGMVWALCCIMLIAAALPSILAAELSLEDLQDWQYAARQQTEFNEELYPRIIGTHRGARVQENLADDKLFLSYTRITSADECLRIPGNPVFQNQRFLYCKPFLSARHLARQQDPLLHDSFAQWTKAHGIEWYHHLGILVIIFVLMLLYVMSFLYKTKY